MAYYMLSSFHSLPRKLYKEPSSHGFRRIRPGFQYLERDRNFMGQCSLSSSSSSSNSTSAKEEVSFINNKVEFGYLLSEFGWKIRRLARIGDEIRKTAYVQAEAFHEPAFFFDDLFFQFFQAEVLSGLLYKLKNSPADRYACLVAEPDFDSDTSNSAREVVGVVDVTVLRDRSVLEHLPSDANEYLYISGIAVSKTFRRKKIATSLLKACDVLSETWGFQYLTLRAYEDDLGAQKLYASAGYKVVSGDPPWMTTWIGKRRRVLMIKCSNSALSSFFSLCKPSSDPWLAIGKSLPACILQESIKRFQNLFPALLRGAVADNQRPFMWRMHEADATIAKSLS